MPCEERDRLEEEHAEARARFDSARERLQARIRICPKNEFTSLSNIVGKGLEDLMRARIALDHHVREHGCEREHEASTNI
jgi:hypothetical protein